MTRADLIKQMDLPGYAVGISYAVLSLFDEHEALRLTEMVQILDIDQRSIKTRLVMLMDRGMVRYTRHGYSRTPELVECLKH